MLLDDYVPVYDVRARYTTQIAAPPEQVYACLRTTRFDHHGATQVLFALRALPTFPPPRVRRGVVSGQRSTHGA